MRTKQLKLLAPNCTTRSHRSACVSEVDLKATHGSDDGDDGLDGVAEDHSFVLLTLLL